MIIFCEKCTMGCRLNVSKGSESIIVEGNLCEKGRRFGETEIIKDKRRMKFKVPVSGGYFKEVTIKTDGEIHKDLWEAVEGLVAELDLKAPIEFGEVVARNIFNIGVNIISERKI